MTDATELDIDAIRARWTPPKREDLQGPGAEFAHSLALMQWSLSRVNDARTDLPAALDEITRLRAALDEALREVGELRLSRAELADECESLRSWVADGKAREVERIADAVARVTPCSCSAQRSRTEAAEQERDEARAEVERLNDKVTEYADLVPRALRGRLDEHADDCPICDHAAWAQLDELCSEEMDRAEAAESALAAVRALADEWRAAGFEIEPDQLTALLASSAPATASETVEVVRGWRVYADGSRSPIERWVRAADGDWISLDSTRRTSGDILIDFEEHRDA